MQLHTIVAACCARLSNDRGFIGWQCDERWPTKTDVSMLAYSRNFVTFISDKLSACICISHSKEEAAHKEEDETVAGKSV